MWRFSYNLAGPKGPTILPILSRKKKTFSENNTTIIDSTVNFSLRIHRQDARFVQLLSFHRFPTSFNRILA